LKRCNLNRCSYGQIILPKAFRICPPKPVCKFSCGIRSRRAVVFSESVRNPTGKDARGTATSKMLVEPTGWKPMPQSQAGSLFDTCARQTDSKNARNQPQPCNQETKSPSPKTQVPKSQDPSPQVPRPESPSPKTRVPKSPSPQVPSPQVPSPQVPKSRVPKSRVPSPESRIPSPESRVHFHLGSPLFGE